MPYPSLAGKVAVVTGGARWIGLEISRRLLEEQCSVIVADIDEAAGREALAALGDRNGRLHYAQTDVTDAGSVERLAATAESEYGRVDILVNNASILATLERGPFWELSSEEWQRSLDVNLTGMWQAMAAVAPGMIDRRSGSIVNMSSGVVYVGKGRHSHYVAAKAGVVGLTRSAARELGPHNVRVNAVAPGFVETERARLTPERREAITADMALAEVPRPGDIAAAVAFLASEEAARVTGQVLSVDSGLTHH